MHTKARHSSLFLCSVTRCYGCVQASKATTYNQRLFVALRQWRRLVRTTWKSGGSQPVVLTELNLQAQRLNEFYRIAQLALVVVDVALCGANVLVARKGLNDPCIYPLVSKLREKLAAPAV